MMPCAAIGGDSTRGSGKMRDVMVIDIEGAPHAAVSLSADMGSVEQTLHGLGLAPALEVGSWHDARLFELVDIAEWREYNEAFGIESSELRFA